MPTARELLEQADALMRRNRSAADSIPVLTDSVADALAEPALEGPSTRERASDALLKSGAEDGREDVGAANAAESEALAIALDRSIVETVEPPVLTDAVEEVAVDSVPLPVARGEDDAAPWLGPDTVDPQLHSVTGPAPDTVAAVPPITLRAAPSFEEPEEEAEAPPMQEAPTHRAAGSAPTPPPAGSASAFAESLAADAAATSEPLDSLPGDAGSASEMLDALPANASSPSARLGALSAHAIPEIGDEERWRALAEHISMQVLQRLDLFVDTGLKARLAAHLQPIVERAGTELVEAINEHVGQLVRSYVAEAIEREIAQWRQDQR